ncbi:hypothetical protein Y032_0015g2714 [Ancylostoma ceylanicum]|uniref:Uncharacterized protein n=1 Tax=Ancylostoma ceylanicum TaxID=53326 RepID=A0A016V9A4_9BILA|nr:hypothetical protein Y032_0015g2714 [Ancylostoma ceylanicum]
MADTHVTYKDFLNACSTYGTGNVFRDHIDQNGDSWEESRIDVRKVGTSLNGVPSRLKVYVSFIRNGG